MLILPPQHFDSDLSDALNILDFFGEPLFRKKSNFYVMGEKMVLRKLSLRTTGKAHFLTSYGFFFRCVIWFTTFRFVATALNNVGSGSGGRR